MKIPKTKHQAVEYLQAGCEQCIANLNELISIHFEIDPPDRGIKPDDEDLVYRLRKVLLHVKAVTGCQIDSDLLHVIGPEIRVADEQIDMIWKQIPENELTEYLSLEENLPGMIGFRFSKTAKEILSRYIHPTPQTLILAKEQGGLGLFDEVRYYYIMFVVLGNLVFRYAISLAFISQEMSSEKESPLASVLMKMGGEFGSMSPNDCLAFVSK